MKISVFTDLHIENYEKFGINEETGLARRLHDFEEFLAWMRRFNKEHEVDCCVFGGDWFHKVGVVSTEALNVTRDHFNNETVPYFFVRGNHDMIRRKNPHKHEVVTNIIEGMSVVSAEASVHNFIRDNVALVGYDSQIDVDSIKGKQLVVVHKQPVLTNQYGFKFDGIDWSMLAAHNDQVVFAHYHDYTKFTNNCRALGTPLQLTFGELEAKYVGLYDSADKSFSIFQTEAPKFFDSNFTSADEVSPRDYYNNVGTNIDLPNVINHRKTKTFESELKSIKFIDIVKEYAEKKGKSNYLGRLDDFVRIYDSSTKHVNHRSVTRVILEDFLSYEIADVEVKPGLNIITGVNGCGKTTILEALCWCLFGETTKGLVGDDVIRDGKKNASAKVMFDDGLLIERSRKQGIRVSLNGEDIVSYMNKDTAQAKIEDLLGMNIDTFKAAAYFSQKNLAVFTDLTEAEQIKFVNEILGFSGYDSLLEFVRSESSKVTSLLETQELIKLNATGRIDEIKTSMASYQSNIDRKTSDLDNLLVSIKSQEEIIDSMKFEPGPAGDVTPEMISDKENAIKDHEANITRLMAVIRSSNADIEPIETEICSMEKKIKEIASRKNYLTITINNNKNSIDKINRDITDYTDKINKLSKSECPTCGAAVEIDVAKIESLADSIEKAKISKDGWSSLIHDMNVEYESLDIEEGILCETGASFKEAVSGIKRKTNDANISMLEFEQSRDYFKKLLSDLRETANKQATAKARFDNEVSDKKNEVAKLNAKMAVLSSEIGKDYSEIKLLEDRIAKHSSVIDEADDKTNQLNLELGMWKFWNEAFSYKGIRSLIMATFCNDINDYINSVLATLSNGKMSVEVKPTDTLKSGKVSNKIGIDIYVNGNVRKYKALSGGQQRRVDIAMLLGVNNLIKERVFGGKAPLGLVIFDEVFLFIDTVGSESVADMLKSISKETATFVISHGIEFSSYADRIFSVKMVEDISHVE